MYLQDARPLYQDDSDSMYESKALNVILRPSLYFALHDISSTPKEVNEASGFSLHLVKIVGTFKNKNLV